jgi:hypothetical protein
MLSGYSVVFALVRAYITGDRLRQMLGPPRDIHGFDDQHWLLLIGSLVVILPGTIGIGLLSGWLTARLHRFVDKTAVLLFATSVILVGLGLFPNLYISKIRPVLLGCLGDWRCRLTPLTWACGTVLIWVSASASIVYGGLRASTTRISEENQNAPPFFDAG